MTKQEWLNLAEVINALRVLPRLLLAAFGTLTAVVTHEMLEWYTALPAVERTVEASGFALGAITAVSGFSLKFATAYLEK